MTKISLDIPGVKPLAISGDDVSPNRRIIAVEMEPMTVLMPSSGEVYEIHMPYLVSILNLSNLHMNLFCRTSPITNEDQVLYNLPFPHVADNGGLCYNPNLNIGREAIEQLEKDPVRLALACMQVFLMGENKYFIGSAFPKEYTETAKESPTKTLNNEMSDDEWWEEFDRLQKRKGQYFNRGYYQHNAVKFLKWWESLSEDDVLNLSYIRRTTLSEEFKREHSLSQSFMDQRARTLQHGNERRTTSHPRRPSWGLGG